MRVFFFIAVWAVAIAAAAPLDGKSREFARRVTISCRYWGAQWNAPGMGQAIDEVQPLDAIGVQAYFPLTQASDYARSCCIRPGVIQGSVSRFCCIDAGMDLPSRSNCGRLRQRR